VRREGASCSAAAPLTALQQPMYELGMRACNLLVNILTNPTELAEIHTNIRLPAELMLRDSCRPFVD
jgi:DNA-binding LacI/PurR family transcriptional regulator